MKKEQIPLIGVDERPLNRQMSPGLASEITNLVPDGDPQDPYWKPVDLAQSYKNGSGTPLPVSASRLKMYWHSRSRVGKYGDSAGSLMRLVSITDAGLVEVIDPDAGAGWTTVASHEVESTDAGDWDLHFDQMYDMGFITVTKGGKPQMDLILEDDLLLEFKYPALPRIQTFTAPTSERFTDEEVQAGGTKGFTATGSVYIRYAYRLRSGELVGHSLPEQVVIPGRSLNFNHELIHHFQGYKAEPANFEYWKDKIAGVSILCSEFDASTWSDSFLDKTAQMRQLAETAWYEIGSFDFIDKAEAPTEDLTFRNTVSEETITGNLIADVDDNTHHIKRHAVPFVYNSRMILGGERTQFGPGVLNGKEASSNMFVYFMEGENWRGSYEAHSTNVDGKYPKSIHIYSDTGIQASGATILASSGVTLEFLTGAFGARYAVTSETAGWTATIQFAGFGTLAISQDDFSDNENGVIMHTPTGMNIMNIRMEVDIETDLGNYTRVHDGSEQIQIWRSSFVSRDGSADYAWLPKGSVLGYPDIRAKEIRLYRYQLTPTPGYYLSNTFSLRASKRANYAVTYIRWVDLYTTATAMSNASKPTEYLASKVAVSNVNDLLGYPSDQAYTVGSGNESITGFAVNAIAISEGQYGQYPLYVFKENGVWSLEQSGDPDVLFARVSPIDTQFGVADQNKITNVSETIFYVNRSGIQMLEGGRRQEISQPIRSKVASIQVLGSYTTENDRFLIAGLDTGDQWWFSVEHGRWFRVTQSVRQYLNVNGNGYFVGTDGVLYDMQSRNTDPVAVVVELPALHWGLPDTLKRFHWLYIRAVISGSYDFSVTLDGKVFSSQSVLRLRPRWRAVFDTSLRLEATMSEGDYLHRFEAELEARYTDRIKQG